MQDLKKLARALEECEINVKECSGIVFSATCDSSILAKFPKPKLNNVPPVFLHKPIKFPLFMCKTLSLGIKFYEPYYGNHYTKICCLTFDDHKALTQYFKSKQLPFHTFGHPKNRKMKVVLKGLPKNLDLEHFRKELQSISIPIVSVHEMKNLKRAEERPRLVLFVVPNNDEGRKILQIQKYFEHKIEIEPLKPKSKQCFRCQKWGHAQRYCNGYVKCVRCGENHLYEECTRNPKCHSKCANCSSDHTASCRQCPFSPNSPGYEQKRLTAASTRAMFPGNFAVPRKLVTYQNCSLFMRGQI